MGGFVLTASEYLKTFCISEYKAPVIVCLQMLSPVTSQRTYSHFMLKMILMEKFALIV